MSRQKFLWFTLFLGFCMAPSLIASNHPPVVSSVQAVQRLDASKLVDITYTLEDTDGDTCTVTLQASDDGGATWTVPITAVSGAVGSGITSGTGRKITWNPSVDLPGVSGSQYRIRIIADDGQSPTGMAYIPAGEYVMGDHHDGMSDALPVHAVYIDGFWMDTYEVTNAQYAAGLNWANGQGNLITVNANGIVYKAGSGTSYPYCATTSASSYSRITWNGSTFGVTVGKEAHPMVCVSWYGSVAYANWRSAMEGKTPCYDLSTWTCNFGAGGYRLPTEAEWEKAARGGNYTPYYRYPWGNSLIATIANYSGSGDPYEVSPSPYTTPAGFYTGALHQKATFNWPGSQTSYQTSNGKNGWGLYDMAGNVYEWCNDWYSSTYYSSSPYDNPKGPTSGTYRVLRGGSWYFSSIILRCADRYYDAYPDYWYYFNGFRLALD